MDKKAFEKIKVALYSIPYEKFSNEISPQNIKTTNSIRDNKIEINEIVTHPKNSKKMVKTEDRKQNKRGVTNSENVSYSKFDKNGKDEDKLKQSNIIPKYLVPIIVVSASKKQTNCKQKNKQGKKVQFSSPETNAKFSNKQGPRRSPNYKSKTSSNQIPKRYERGKKRHSPTDYSLENRPENTKKETASPPAALTRKYSSAEVLFPPSAPKCTPLQKSNSVPRGKKKTTDDAPQPRLARSGATKSGPRRDSDGVGLRPTRAGFRDAKQFHSNSFRLAPKDARCECHPPWARPLGGPFACSHKRTTMSGILAPEGVQGKNILKESQLNMMMKETLRERLWNVHGVGCR